MRYLTAGDSHGEYLVGIVEGFPAGHRVDLRAIERDLARRRVAYGRSARQKIEGDAVEIVSGLWKGRTTGAPLAILIRNLARTVSGKPGGALGNVPRPGHADLPGALKYDFDQVPPIAERASARGTAMRVAIGALAKSVLGVFSVDILAHVTSIGGVDAPTHAGRGCADSPTPTTQGRSDVRSAGGPSELSNTVSHVHRSIAATRALPTA